MGRLPQFPLGQRLLVTRAGIPITVVDAGFASVLAALRRFRFARWLGLGVHHLVFMAERGRSGWHFIRSAWVFLCGRRGLTAPFCQRQRVAGHPVWGATISSAPLFFFAIEHCAWQGHLRMAPAKFREPGARFFVPSEPAQFGEAGQPLVGRQLRQCRYRISVGRSGLPAERARFGACVSGLWRRWRRG